MLCYGDEKRLTFLRSRVRSNLDLCRGSCVVETEFNQEVECYGHSIELVIRPWVLR